HFKTDQGIENLTREEAARIAGENPDHATCDLYDAIARGEFPSWTVNVQIMPVAEAESYRWDVFDITKVWPHSDYPLIPIGKMVLNGNPSNYFAEVEQAAFSPGNFVPGIAASPDKMLQARIHSYHDAHLYRLGSNYQLLPVNAPKGCAAHTYQRDGSMRCDDNGGGGPNYWPNSMGGPEPEAGVGEPPFEVSGTADRHAYVHLNDDFAQAGALFGKVMSGTDREHLIGNIAAHLGNAQKRLQLRQCALFFKADPDYGNGVADALGLDKAEVERLAGLSQEERVKATMG
ncbi:MAG: catalase, partial [Candidatus Hydrogenedentes bacterium]|nr:catalase [Candidatus Hydrogenedentota bacterium]